MVLWKNGELENILKFVSMFHKYFIVVFAISKKRKKLFYFEFVPFYVTNRETFSHSSSCACNSNRLNFIIRFIIE